MLLLVMMTTAMMTAWAAGAPDILTHPDPQIVIEGGRCVFEASAKGETGITWRLQSPDGRQDYPFTDAPKHFRGLTVSGKNSDKLSLSNIPGEMDGWLVYCRYSNKAGRVDTDMVPLFVTDRSGMRINGGEPEEPAATPAPPRPDGDVRLPGADEMILRAVGCQIQFIDKDGNAKGDSFTELNFGEPYYNTLTRRNVTDGTVDVRITADAARGQRVEYWVINGAKYTFNTEVKSFTLRELTYSMTIEAVCSATAAQTLATPEQIQQQRTGKTLLVEAKNARMAHVNHQGKAAGGTFAEFDFTQDFINRATNELEDGGCVTVHVTATVPEGMIVTFWRFNEARLNFNSDVYSFTVESLSHSMRYQPVLYTKTTPVPEYTVTCHSCTFSGGGYTNAKSGTVPYGTKITITPSGNASLGYWTGSYNAGAYHAGVSNKPITWTVKKNCSFEWHAEIN